jgi:phage terminase large subunit
VDGIQHTASCLQDGTIKINSCCKRTIQEFGLYSWDDKAGEDKPIKENDHAMDAVRYFVNTTQIWRKKRPYQPIYTQLTG